MNRTVIVKVSLFTCAFSGTNTAADDIVTPLNTVPDLPNREIPPAEIPRLEHEFVETFREWMQVSPYLRNYFHFTEEEQQEVLPRNEILQLPAQRQAVPYLRLLDDYWPASGRGEFAK